MICITKMLFKSRVRIKAKFIKQKPFLNPCIERNTYLGREAKKKVTKQKSKILI